MNAAEPFRASRVLAAADRLDRAAASGVPTDPVRDLVDTADIGFGYEVQQLLRTRREARGAGVVGRKIGLTSPAVQQQIGVDRPDFGVLFDDMLIPDNGRLPVGRLLQPRAEAEIAFVLAYDLDGEIDVARVAAAVSHVCAAIEIVDSRIRDWDIGIVDTVADNASSGAFVLGRQQLTLAEISPRDCEMTMTVDGVVESTGNGAACLGDPLEAVTWLARTVQELGDPLRAGEVILSGALGPLVPLRPGQHVTADITGLGSVSFGLDNEGTHVSSPTKVAVIGSGNIGTDLMIKIHQRSEALELAALVGIDPESEGLARARRLGVPTTADGVAGLVAMPGFDEVEIVLDATSAAAHRANAEALRPYGVRLIDLTPAALGPFVVPPVNLGEHLDAHDINMVTCGGQATIPIVAAVASVTPVPYAEIVASVSSRSAGPGTRANIDEFTETTARAVESVGGAERGKAVIILNPAEPPLIMRDTVFCLVGDADREEIERAVTEMVAAVATYVPGYRLKQRVQFSEVTAPEVATLVPDPSAVRWKVTVFLEVEGAADYLPAYAGNLDIMTAAAVAVATRIARADQMEVAVS